MHRSFVLGPIALYGALAIFSCDDPDSPSTPGGPGDGATTLAFSAVCLHYASHVTDGECGAPALPPAEVERVTPRWAQHCEDLLAMPGSTLTAAALDQCLTLLETGDCLTNQNPPDACLSAGTLPANAACNQNGAQCASGACLGTLSQAPCGNCVAPAALGQACDPTGTANLCVLGSSCISSATSATCTAVTLGVVGATCTTSNDCASGLICDPTTLTCSKPPGIGAACSDPFSCSFPNVCNVTNNAGTTCQAPGVAGTPCLFDEFCEKGLGCSQAAGTCGPISWQSAGQPCDGDLARCLVGSCPQVEVPACPTIVKDGDVCTQSDPTQTCDVAAVCFSGKCVSGTKVICQ
jgi:hypothetical protein